MEAGYDTILKILEMVTATASQNPYAVIAAVVVMFFAYGFIIFQRKKIEDRRINADRNRDIADNIDDIEADTSRSNDSIRRRLRNRRK